jgi:hypothetical protein
LSQKALGGTRIHHLCRASPFSRRNRRPAGSGHARRQPGDLLRRPEKLRRAFAAGRVDISPPFIHSSLRVRRFGTSNLVGCSIGNSPGFAPRRILSVYSAAPLERPTRRLLHDGSVRDTPPRPSGRKAAAAASGHLDIVVLQRERADALARRLEIGIEYRGRRHADRRLANAAPRRSAARRDYDRFDVGHFGDAH